MAWIYSCTPAWRRSSMSCRHLMRRIPMNLVHRSIVTLAAMVAVLLGATLARGDVRDNANIFSKDAVDKANAAMADMQRKHNKTFVVETFPAIPDELKDQYQQQPKDTFFRDWMASR